MERSGSKGWARPLRLLVRVEEVLAVLGSESDSWESHNTHLWNVIGVGGARGVVLLSVGSTSFSLTNEKLRSLTCPAYS